MTLKGGIHHICVRMMRTLSSISQNWHRSAVKAKQSTEGRSNVSILHILQQVYVKHPRRNQHPPSAPYPSIVDSLNPTSAKVLHPNPCSYLRATALTRDVRLLEGVC